MDDVAPTFPAAAPTVVLHGRDVDASSVDAAPECVVLQGREPDVRACDGRADRVWLLDSRTSLRCGADMDVSAPIIARAPRRVDSGSNTSSALSSDSSFLGTLHGRSSRSSSMSSLLAPPVEDAATTKRAESPLPSGLLHRVSFASLPPERRCDSPSKLVPNVMGVAARAQALLAQRAAANAPDAPKQPRRPPRPRFEPPPFEQLYRYDSEDEAADDEGDAVDSDAESDGRGFRIRRAKPPRLATRSRGRPRGRLATASPSTRRPSSPDRLRPPIDRHRSESRGRARKPKIVPAGTVIECLSDGFEGMDIDDDTPRPSAPPSADEWIDETTSASSSLSSSPSA